MTERNKSIYFITRTAMGVALVILAQLIGKMLPAGTVIVGPFSVTQLVTGSLVNCVLFVFTAQVGMLSGVLIGILSSILASIIGIGPAVIAVVPLVAAGNCIIAVVYGLLGKKNAIMGIVCAAVLKCAFLWLTVPSLLRMIGAPAKQTAALSIMFSWPQGLTALIGGILAFIIIQRLRKSETSV